MAGSILKFRSKITQLTYLALLVTFAVVIHTIEAALPLPMPVPGVKLGLANIIIILVLVLFGLRSGLIVAGSRSILGSLLMGGLFGFGFWLSIGASITSCTAMGLVLFLQKKGSKSLLVVSITGALVHNFTQISLASLIIANPALLKAYFPLMIILSIPTGIFTGIAALHLEEVIRRILKQNNAIL